MNLKLGWALLGLGLGASACGYQPYGRVVTNPAKPSSPQEGTVTSPATGARGSETNPAGNEETHVDPVTNPALSTDSTNPALN